MLVGWLEVEVDDGLHVSPFGHMVVVVDALVVDDVAHVKPRGQIVVVVNVWGMDDVLVTDVEVVTELVVTSDVVTVLTVEIILVLVTLAPGTITFAGFDRGDSEFSGSLLSVTLSL